MQFHAIISGAMINVIERVTGAPDNNDKFY